MTLTILLTVTLTITLTMTLTLTRSAQAQDPALNYETLVCEKTLTLLTSNSIPKPRLAKPTSAFISGF